MFPQKELGLGLAALAIVLVWVFSISLHCIPLFEICGHYGYDAVEGVCHWMHMMCPQHWIKCLSVMEFHVLFFWYLMAWPISILLKQVKMKRLAAREDMILTFSYIVFILMHSIFESLPKQTANGALLEKFK